VAYVDYVLKIVTHAFLADHTTVKLAEKNSLLHRCTLKGAPVIQVSIVALGILQMQLLECVSYVHIHAVLAKEIKIVRTVTSL